MTKLQNRCANCGGKFGLVYHHHWGLRFCRKACKDDFLAKTAARMRKWFGWTSNRPICQWPAQIETEAESSCDDTKAPTSGRKLISYTSVTMGMCSTPTQENPGKKSAVKQARRVGGSAYKGHLMILAERGVRFASKVDYLIRRWAIPDHPCNVRQPLS